MQVNEVLRRHGGIVDAAVLLAATSRRQVQRALREGEIVREARRRYAVPHAHEARRAAHRVGGVVTGLSAATLYGWKVKEVPERPVVTVPRRRSVPTHRRTGIDLRFADLHESDHRNGVLLPGPTVVDCARRHDLDVALSVADSALRSGEERQELRTFAECSPRTGRSRAMRVAELADGRAANPFESVLRAIAIETRRLDVEPQVTISEGGWTGRPDLVDAGRRLVLEADSYGFHASRTQLRRDCRRYTALTLLGWRVVRFSWEDGMHHADYVAACLRMLADLPPIPPLVRRRRRTSGQAVGARELRIPRLSGRTASSAGSPGLPRVGAWRPSRPTTGSTATSCSTSPAPATG